MNSSSNISIPIILNQVVNVFKNIKKEKVSPKNKKVKSLIGSTKDKLQKNHKLESVL